MNKTTIDYSQQILSRKCFKQEDFNFSPIHHELDKRMGELNLKKKELCQRVNLDTAIGYKYLNNTRKMSREIAIAFLIELKFNYDDIQRILKENNYQFIYSKLPYDQILLYAINNNYSLKDTNDLLVRYDFNKLI